MYETLITKKGQELLAKALSTNTQVALKEVRFSDFSGEINENMETLTGIKHKQDITSNKIDPLNSNTIIIETLIPANIGGFYINTIGVYTVKGELFALAKINQTYKPLLSENLATDLHVKLYLQVGNASNVILNIDESVVLASRDFVNEQIKTIEISKANKTDLDNYYLNTKGEELNKRLIKAETYCNNLSTNKANKTEVYTKLEFDASQKAQDEKIKELEINKANNTDLKPIKTQITNLEDSKANKTEVYTKLEFDASQKAQEEKIKELEINKANKSDLEPITTQITNLEDSKANKTELTNLVKEKDLNTKLINYIQKTDVKVNFMHHTTLGFATSSEIINTDVNSLWIVTYYPTLSSSRIIIRTSKNQSTYYEVAYSCDGAKSVVLGYGHSVHTRDYNLVGIIEIFKISLGA